MNYEFKKEMIVKKVRADYSDLKQKAYKWLSEFESHNR